MVMTIQEQHAHSLNAMEEHNKIHTASGENSWFLKSDKKVLQAIYKKMKV